MPTGTVNLPQLMSPQEAADYIGVHINTMFRWLKEGTVPGVRLGSRWFINAAQLSEVLTTGGGETEQPAGALDA